MGPCKNFPAGHGDVHSSSLACGLTCEFTGLIHIHRNSSSKDYKHIAFLSLDI